MQNENDLRCDKYKALFMLSRDAVMTLEPPSWKFQSANPATVKMFGAKDEEDFLRYPPWELSPKLQPDGSISMGKAIEMIDEAMLKGSSFFEWTHKRIDGEDFPAEVLLSKIESGGKVYLHALVRDITERKKLQEAVLKSAEEKFEIIFNNVNDGLLLARLEDKKFVLGNKAISRMLGYTTEELKTLGLSDIHPAENLDKILEQFIKQSSGEIGVIRDIPVKRKDGSIFYADVNTSSVTIDGVRCNLGVFRDTTEQRAMVMEKEQYFSFFQLATDIMVIADTKGNFIKVNPACTTVLGYSQEELLSKAFIDFIHKDDKQLTLTELDKRITSGHVLDFENRFIRKDGSICLLSWRANYDKESGNTYATARDITRHHEEEERIKRLANLYEILSNCNQAIVHSKTEQELFQKICSDVIHFDHIRMAWMGFVDPETKLIRIIASDGADAEHLKNISISIDVGTPFGHGPTGIAIREKRPYWCQDFQNDPATKPWRDEGRGTKWGSSASLPIYRGGQAVGALALHSGEKEVFDEDAQRLLLEMTMNISYALDNFEREAERIKSENELRNKYEEVEKLNRFMVGREIKMADLKNEIERLRSQIDKK